MFAVIKLSGLQFIVKKGDKIKVHKLPNDIGEELTITDVLAKGNGEKVEIGSPFVQGAQVKVKLLEQKKDKKVIIFKKKRRHNYRKKVGFRQSVTIVEVLDII